MRRGLTMIELLIALSLLSVVLMAVVSWTQVTAHASQRAAGPVRWQSAAEAVLALIHDDLISGDLTAAGAPGDRSQPRVEAIDGTLQIETRGVGAAGPGGPVVHRYALEVSSGELRLQQRTPGGARSTRLLLDRVSAWECAIDDEAQLLRVTLSSAEGMTIARSYPLP